MPEVYFPDDQLMHYGVLGMKWGKRRYRNSDGSLTSTGKKRYDKDTKKLSKTIRDSMEKGNAALNASKIYTSQTGNTIRIGDQKLDRISRQADQKVNNVLTNLHNKGWDDISLNQSVTSGRMICDYMLKNQPDTIKTVSIAIGKSQSFDD